MRLVRFDLGHINAFQYLWKLKKCYNLKILVFRPFPAKIGRNQNRNRKGRNRPETLEPEPEFWSIPTYDSKICPSTKTEHEFITYDDCSVCSKKVRKVELSD